MNTQTYNSNDIIQPKDKVHLLSHNKHEHLLCIPHEQALALLSDIKFDVFLEKNAEGIYTAHLEQFKMSAMHPNKMYALYKLTTQIMEYTKAYINNTDLYLQSENHKSHYPYVIKAFLYKESFELLEHLTVTEEVEKGKFHPYLCDSRSEFKNTRLRDLITDARIASAKSLLDSEWSEPRMFDIKTIAEYTQLSIDHVIEIKKELAQQKNSD